jgi:rfaE bifunctional protein nucleotidyltransferase chain/domain
LRIVLAHGTFDLLHYGHLKMFEAAKKLGDILVVTLTADVFVSKGDGRPIFTQSERLFCIKKIRDVDQVEICHHKTGLPMIEKWKPDIYVKGEDYKRGDKHGSLGLERRAVEAYGGKVVFTEGLPMNSSSSLLDRVHESRGCR